MPPMPSVVNRPRFHIPGDLLPVLIGKKRPPPDRVVEDVIAYIPKDAPRPSSARELVSTFEVSIIEEGVTKVLDTGVAWREGDQLYIVRGVPAASNIDELPQPPALPFTHLLPLWKSDTTGAPSPMPSDACLKGQDLHSYDPSTMPAPGALLSAEVELLEFLRIHPHPNVAHYYGCLRNGNFITHACMRSYKCTLEWAMNGDMRLSSRRVSRGVRAALKHLHSLGIAHCNLSIANVMLSENGGPVLINFERACRRAQMPYDGQEQTDALLQVNGAVGGGDEDPQIVEGVSSQEFEGAMQRDYEALQAIEREIDAYMQARWCAKVHKFLSDWCPAYLPMHMQWGRVVRVLTNVLVPMLMFIA